MAALSPGDVIDRYVVDEVLGQGGMATVYRVHHQTLGTSHALKILSVAGRSMRQRLLLEGKVQATLRHPNIVAVTDVLEVDGSPGLLMELIDGPTLDEYLREQEGRRLELADAERIFRGVLAGVAAAHAQGALHRDLKPANVLLAGRERTPKVADFGLAKVLAEADSLGGGTDGRHQTRTGATLGTPEYMSPEQIRDSASADRRADIFSLGCLLYELVAGHRAFVGNDIVEVFNNVCLGRYQPIPTPSQGVPERIGDAIRGCLEVRREDRIADCAGLLAILDRPAPRASLAGSTTFSPDALAPDTGEVERLPSGEAPNTVRSEIPSLGPLLPLLSTPPPSPTPTFRDGTGLPPPSRDKTGFKGTLSPAAPPAAEPGAGAPPSAPPPSPHPSPQERRRPSSRRPPPQKRGVGGWILAAITGTSLLGLLLVGATALAVVVVIGLIASRRYEARMNGTTDTGSQQNVAPIVQIPSAPATPKPSRQPGGRPKAQPATPGPSATCGPFASWGFAIPPGFNLEDCNDDGAGHAVMMIVGPGSPSEGCAAIKAWGLRSGAKLYAETSMEGDVSILMTRGSDQIAVECGLDQGISTLTVVAGPSYGMGIPGM